jgi:hypothetical protein
MIKCSQCGGTRFDKGALRSWFYDNYISESDLKLGKIRIDAYLCLDCNHVEIFASYPRLVKEKLKKRGYLNK